MAVNPQAQALANLLGRVARYSVVLGIGGSALQASLYTGNAQEHFVVDLIIWQLWLQTRLLFEASVLRLFDRLLMVSVHYAPFSWMPLWFLHSLTFAMCS